MQKADGTSPMNPEKSHSLVHVLAHQAAELPDQPFILYPQRFEDNLTYKQITFSQFDKFTDVLAEKYRTQLHAAQLHTALQPTDGDQMPTGVVGLLARTDVQYSLTIFALLKLGLSVFCLSPRNSLSVHQHLTGKTAVKTLVVGPEFLEIGRKLEAEAGVKMLALQDVDFTLNIHSMPGETTKQEKTNDSGDQYIIIQSSGSTGLPKPIYMHPGFMLSLENAFGSLFPTPGVVLNVAPFALGIQASLITTLLIGHTYAIPYYSSWPPSVLEILESLEASGATATILVPSLLEGIANILLAKGDYTFSPLRKLNQVYFGGAPLPKKLGDMLSQAGVNILSLYGSAEVGGLMFTPAKEQRDPNSSWDAMDIIPGINHRWNSSEVNPLLKELVVLPISVLNNVGNEPDGSYRTGDLFIESPPESGLYAYQGRVGNLLVHINGEKTNPDVMEKKIREHLIIEQVLIVGAGRFCTAALVQLRHSEVFRRTLEESIRDAQTAVMVVNEFVPTHSRVLKDMIYILPLSQELPPTDKGTVKRKKAEQQFVVEIERMYQNLLGGKKPDDIAVAKPLDNRHITVESIQQSLKSIVANILGGPESSFDNISISLFYLGLDSLTSLELLNSLSKTYVDLPQNIIFENSSILNLSKALYSRLKGSPAEAAAEKDPTHLRDVEALLDKYSSLIDSDAQGDQPSPPPEVAASGETVVMTGATGGLGNFMLKTMLAEPNVISKIYLLLRGQDAKERLRKSLQDRHLDPAMVEDSRVEILQADLADPHLGLSDETYDRLLTKATAVVHVAWKMDFNLRVTDFEKDTIRGLYNLLVLARGSDCRSKRFHFTSSIGACSNAPLASVPEQIARDPSYSLPNGYSQSKFIADSMCARAAEKWGMPVDIYRVGQISGDTRNGVWNQSEYFPMMIAYGAGWMGELPDKSGDINWIPLDIAAEAICELAFKRQNARESVAEMYHITNPHSITWTNLLGMLHEAGLHFREVRQQEWVDHLIADRANPGNKLAAFWEKVMTEGNQKGPFFETKETCKRSEVMRSCPKVTAEYVALCLRFWKEIGFLDRGF